MQNMKNEPALSLLQHIREAKTPAADARLVVAVSGGADSMALLHLYIRARGPKGLLAATFDHGLRGEQSREDARFVAETAAAWGVRCAVGHGGLSPDAAGHEARAREARYRFLAAAARDFGASYVATAHHADDQAETVLLNLIRGTGARGLGGMRPITPLPHAPELTLIRPLLDARRADLLDYCRAEGIAWRDDPTNADTDYRRNWARHVVLPLLADANPKIVEALTRMASIIGEEDAYLDEYTAGLLKSAAHITPQRVWITRAAFDSWPQVIRRRALIEAALRAAGESFEPDFERFQAALALCDRPEGGTAELGGGMVAEVDTGYISVAHRRSRWTPPHSGFWITRPADAPIPLQKSAPQDAAITVRLPRDAVPFARARRAGDRVFPAGLHGKSQKLKAFFINNKIPRQLRDYLMLIESQGEIIALWDSQRWHYFTPPFDGETIELDLSLI